ncbi:tRNA pseudouridine(38-40) synthase TruA [Candidatus Harpocratesius sp.]
MNSLSEKSDENLLKTHRYLLIIWYIGTNYYGSQRQPGKRTVEDSLIRALKQTGYIIDSESGQFRAGMRTDKGVHAREAAYCFSSEKSIIPRLIDAYLPNDMGIVKYAEVPLGFHPRWSCLQKEYHYYLPLSQSEILNLNFDIIKSGLQKIQGTHDFRHFSKTDRNKPNQFTKLTMISCSVEKVDNAIIFKFQSQAFLWEQIRRTVHFLIKLGYSQRSLDDLDELLKLNSKSEKVKKIRREKPYPASGLVLWKVVFPSEIKFTPYSNALIQKIGYFQKNSLIQQQNIHWFQFFGNLLLDHSKNR